ncbi:T7SS effector LXG polymorphic toxin [Lactovum odontotermitis]
MGRILDTGDIAAATGGESAITDTIGAFNSVKSEMTDFVDNQALKGQGWDSARNVINNVFQVLTNAYTMWGELILEANAKLGAAASKLKNGFIDEDALKHQIAMIKSNIVTVQYEMQAAQMYPASTAADAAAAASMVSACQFRIRELEKQQKKIQEELDSLDEFDSATSGLYAEAMALQSQINGLLTNVTNKGTWSTPTGLFTTEHLNMKLVDNLAAQTSFWNSLKNSKLSKKDMQKAYQLYKKNSATRDAMEKFLKAVSDGKDKKTLNALYDDLVSFTKNKADLKQLNGIVKNLQVKYPDAKLTLRTERPKVMDRDSIRVIRSTYEWNGQLNGVAYVINETTGKILSQENIAPAAAFYGNDFSGAVVEYIKNLPKVERPMTSFERSVNESGWGDGVAGIVQGLVTQHEINSSLKTENKVVTGKEYLKTEKNATKKEAERKAEQERLDNLKDWQMISNQNMNFGRH